MFMRMYTIYAENGKEIWTTPFEDEAYNMARYDLGEYVSVTTGNGEDMNEFQYPSTPTWEN